MQAAVRVFFGLRDIVIKLAGDGVENIVDYAERLVTLRDALHDDTNRAHVVNLAEGQVLALHLAVNAVDVLGPSLDIRFQSFAREMFLDVGRDPLHIGFAVGTALVQLRGNFAVTFRFQVAKGEVFQFPLELPDAQAVGNRGEDVNRLFGFLNLFRRGHIAEGAHIMQPVGQFDQNHAEIRSHCQERFSQIFRFAVTGFAAVHAINPGRQRFQLGHAINQFGDFGAELPLDVYQGDAGIFNHVMQQPGGNRDGIQAEIG